MVYELHPSGQNRSEVPDLTQGIPEGSRMRAGEVALIGAGPGDPELLTIKALRLIQQADVMVYDRLVSEAIVNLGKDDIERIYVGKKCGFHTRTQEEICGLLVELAQQNKKVVRLKGGDPFIFGRGGEEVDVLMDAGVTVKVVPGITAASGCSSYAGIPLTHRDCAQSVTFVTGHLKEGALSLNWSQLAQQNQTVVFYMGIKNASVISQELQKAGLKSSTPVAIVKNGTQPSQKMWMITLADLPDAVVQHEIKPPALLIVGDVVAMAREDARSGTLYPPVDCGSEPELIIQGQK